MVGNTENASFVRAAEYILEVIRSILGFISSDNDLYYAFMLGLRHNQRDWAFLLARSAFLYGELTIDTTYRTVVLRYRFEIHIFSKGDVSEIGRDGD
jgi:hypothetical protein